MIFKGVTLILEDGLEEGDLRIEDGRIVEIGPSWKLRGEADVERDLGEAVLLPGFVDAHTHISVRPGDGDQHGQLGQPLVWQALRGARNVRDMLRSGVTTARIMGERGGLDLWIARPGRDPQQRRRG